MSDGISRIPSDGETGALFALKDAVVGWVDVTGDGVRRETRVDVGPDRVTLGSVRVLCSEVFYGSAGS